MFYIKGKVVKGDGYGKKIGFPTVNLETGKEILPPVGVYAGRVVLEGKEYRAGIVVGENAKVEGHLIGYSGDAYGKVVNLTLEKFLREYKKFETEEELINQIKKDIQLC